MATRNFLIILLFFTWGEALAGNAIPIQILYYSGNPEIQVDETTGGLPALATLLNTLRQQDKPLLFIHGGRAIAPSTLSSFDRGTHMIDLLNELNPVSFSVGKSEFAFKEDELTLRSKEASFPFLSANLFDPITGGPPEGVKSFLLHRINNLNIGLFSITNPELMSDYILDRVTILNTKDIINQTAEQLKADGADLVIMMADFIIPDTLTEELIEKDNIDIILISERERTPAHDNSKIVIVHGRSDNAVIIEMTPDQTKNDLSWTFDYTIEELQPIIPDPEMTESINSYLSQLTRFLEIEIGVTKSELDTRKEIIRVGENAFGNLVADAIRSYFKADIGLMNSGGIRGNKIYKPGTVLTRGDMLREIPYRNHAVQIDVTGKQLLDALENGFSRIEDIKGSFPHLSGMTVSYNPESEPFNRVRSAMVGGKKLSPEKTYKLATVNFLADGGDGYQSFKDCERTDKFGSSRLLWEYVRDYIAERKEISPTKEGRLKIVSE